MSDTPTLPPRLFPALWKAWGTLYVAGVSSTSAAKGQEHSPVLESGPSGGRFLFLPGGWGWG